MLLLVILLYLKMINMSQEYQLILMQLNHESVHFKEMERFSITESYVLTHLVKQLHDYQLDDMNFTLDDVIVQCRFIEESVYITYLYEIPIYARLDYDLVFDSALDYTYISSLEALQIDKIKV